MKYGILGAAHGHVFTFARHMAEAGWTLAGILRDGEPNAEKLAAEYDAPFFDGPEALFAQGITVAGCFSPNCERIGMVRLCADHGVHVMSDKPLAVDENGLHLLEQILQEGRIQVGILFTARFQPSIQALKAVLDSGELGDLVSLEILNPHKLTPEKRPEWHFSQEKSGGVAADLFTHSVDLFHWLTGRRPIVAHESLVVKSVLPEKPEFHDFASALVHTADGVSGYFRVDWHMPETHWNWGDMRIFCVGTAGCAEVRATGDPLTRRETLIVYSPEGGTREEALPPSAENETTDFLSRAAGGPSSVTQHDVLYACRLPLALDRAAHYSNRFA